MIFARIDNIQNNQIFQQIEGRADVVVTGQLEGMEQPGENDYVFAYLEREYNGTWVIPAVQCSWEGKCFRGRLEKIPAGGPYTLRVRYVRNGDWDGALNGDVRYRIGVGDIWVVAGQSNALGYAHGPVMDAAQGRVHLFHNSCRWQEAVHPLGGGYEQGECFCAGVSPFISFGKTLVQELNYPIGLLMTAVGGSPLEQWESGSVLYERMLRIVEKAGGCVRGIAWYQGCTDTDNPQDAKNYLPRFQAMVRDMRKALGDEELPVLTVQLNKTFGNLSREHDESWAMVKEAQRQAARQMKNVWMMTSSDLALSDFVHNNSVSCSVLGQRLAWQALEQIYKKEYMGTPPDVACIKREGRRVSVLFEPVYSFLVNCGLPVEKSDFIFEDTCGRIEIDNCGYAKNACEFLLKREPIGDLLCSFAPYCMNSGTLPFDRATGIPPASFYHVLAQLE